MSRASARRIDGQTKLMGIVGHQIEFTISPVIHNFAANQLGQNIAYVPFDIAPEKLDELLDTLWDLGCVGFNVTTPHKHAVAKLVETELSAVNTVSRGPNGWVGSSTAGVGFDRGIQRMGCQLAEFKTVIFLGAGGAVASLLTYFQDQKLTPDITVLRRRADGDEALQAAAPNLSMSFAPWSIEDLQTALDGQTKETLFIQASSAPVKGDDLVSLTPALDNYNGYVVDLVYSHPSQLYFHALSKDLKAQDGEAMLIEQARASQMAWWSRTIEYDVLVEVIRGRK